MSNSWHGHPGQPAPVNTPEKRPGDVRSTNQAQSEQNTLELQGERRGTKVLLWIIGLVLAALIVTIVIDAFAGRGLL